MYSSVGACSQLERRFISSRDHQTFDGVGGAIPFGINDVASCNLKVENFRECWVIVSLYMYLGNH